MLVLDSSFTGLNSTLCLDIEPLRNCANDMWCGNSHHHSSIETYVNIMGHDLDCTLSRRHSNAYKLLGLNKKSIQWHHALGPDAHRRILSQRVGEIDDFLCKNSEYVTTFLKNSSFLDSLEGAHITEGNVERLVTAAKSPSVVSTIRSFTGVSPLRVKYNMSSTTTGRLTVNSGPQVLTVPAVARRHISPSNGGTLYMSDLRSLEPRIASYVAGKMIGKDFYHDIQRTIGTSLPRKIIKLAVLSSMYGASRKTVAREVGADADQLMKSVRQYLDIASITRNLTTEYMQFGYIKNMFGRPIYSGDVSATTLYSHFVQSSANDLAISAFSEMVDKLRESDVVIIPKLVVHDAIIFELVGDTININDHKFQEIDLGKAGKFPIQTSVLYDG